MRTKIDANGTLVDFVTHVEDICVRVCEGWGGEDEERRRWALNFFTSKKLYQSWHPLIDNLEPRRWSARTTAGGVLFC